MLADSMQELRLAGERFIKVEDWQNDELLPKYIDIPAGTRAQPCYFESSLYDSSRVPEAHNRVRVFGVGSWITSGGSSYVPRGAKTYIVDAREGMNVAWYYNMPGTGSKDTEEAGRTNVKGIIQVLASQIKIGGVISTLFANIRHLLSREVVAC